MHDVAGLAPETVTEANFKKLFSTSIVGGVWGQPLLYQGAVYAATDADRVYAIDALSGNIRWARAIGSPQPAGPGQGLKCADIAPSLGVLSTPAIDRSSSTLFVSARNLTPGVGQWELHALNLRDGSERQGWPATIAGAAANDPSAIFDGGHLLQRPGLLIMGGRVWLGFGSICDEMPFRGWIASVSVQEAQTRLWTDEPGRADGAGGIWQSGGGLVDDGQGHVLLATGNGSTDEAGPQPRVANSVVRLNLSADGTLSVADFFAPFQPERLNEFDADVGSGNPIVLPDGFDGLDGRRTVFQVSKGGSYYLLDLTHLGGIAQQESEAGSVLAETKSVGALSHPAAWPAAGGLIYVTETEIRLTDMPPTSRPHLRVYRVSAAHGHLALSGVGAAADPLGYGSGSPIITSKGADPASGLVWLIAQPPGTSGPAELRAYNPIPTADSLSLHLRIPIGHVGRFAMPATDGIRMYVGAADGSISAYGPTGSPAP